MTKSYISDVDAQQGDFYEDTEHRVYKCVARCGITVTEGKTSYTTSWECVSKDVDLAPVGHMKQTSRR